MRDRILRWLEIRRRRTESANASLSGRRGICAGRGRRSGRSREVDARRRNRPAPGRATVVHGDDFYRPMAHGDRLLLSPQDGYDRYFDWQRLRDRVLVPLASGSAARYQRYDWPTGQVAAGKLHQAPRSPGRASPSSREYTRPPGTSRLLRPDNLNGDPSRGLHAPPGRAGARPRPR